MRIYTLTSVGRALAANPSGDDKIQILYWLRRRGFSGTDEQAVEQLHMTHGEVHTLMHYWERNKAVVCTVNA